MKAYRIGSHGWWFDRAEVEQGKDWVLDQALDRGGPGTGRPEHDNRVSVKRYTKAFDFEDAANRYEPIS